MLMITQVLSSISLVTRWEFESWELRWERWGTTGRGTTGWSTRGAGTTGAKLIGAGTTDARTTGAGTTDAGRAGARLMK